MLQTSWKSPRVLFLVRNVDGLVAEKSDSSRPGFVFVMRLGRQPFPPAAQARVVRWSRRIARSLLVDPISPPRCEIAVTELSRTHFTFESGVRTGMLGSPPEGVDPPSPVAATSIDSLLRQKKETANTPVTFVTLGSRAVRFCLRSGILTP
ncbi:MAG: hypothetical protein CBC13_10900 [Planctomycetia bacterium TMED53]|nr:MAG: hypothetical protein CBC13_10900 [Planctomycetia bacterium TMED53]